MVPASVCVCGDVPAPRGADAKLYPPPDPRVCVCPVGAGTVPSGLSDAPASVSDPSFQVGSLEPPSCQQKFQESFLKDEKRLLFSNGLQAKETEPPR